MISIKVIIHAYAATLKKTWKYDRKSTVGASEIGGCARRTWFDKHGAPRDPDYVESWGAALRGTLIEQHLWTPALRACLPADVQLLYAHPEQKTFVDGYLSATTDGLLVFPDHTSVNLDCKSIDPRVTLQKEKAEHAFQVQVQAGVLRARTPYQPGYSIISYIDASFYDNVTEFPIRFNPRIYKAAQARAEQIMTARDALELPPEGKMAGGDECEYCAWASHCAAVTVTGVPKDKASLSEEQVAELKGLRDDLLHYRTSQAAIDAKVAERQEDIKQFLRRIDSRGYKGADFSVSYSAVSGKATFDIAAIEASGLDLEPFRKAGKPSERLVVK